MKQHRLVGCNRSRRRVTTIDSNHAHPLAADLLVRYFTPQEVARPNRFWCGDITYYPPRKVGFIWRWSKTCSRVRIPSWALGETLEATLVATAWRRALKTRGFNSNQGPEPCHRDRGQSATPWLMRAICFATCCKRLAPKPA